MPARDHRQQGPKIASCCVCRRDVRQLQKSVIVHADPLKIRHAACVSDDETGLEIPVQSVDVVVR